MLKISWSEIVEFHKVKHPNNIRLGQAFYNYFKLHKIKNKEDMKVCDKLWSLDGKEAQKIIDSVTDYTN